MSTATAPRSTRPSLVSRRIAEAKRLIEELRTAKPESSEYTKAIKRLAYLDCQIFPEQDGFNLRAELNKAVFPVAFREAEAIKEAAKGADGECLIMSLNGAIFFGTRPNYVRAELPLIYIDGKEGLVSEVAAGLRKQAEMLLAMAKRVEAAKPKQ